MPNFSAFADEVTRSDDADVPEPGLAGDAEAIFDDPRKGASADSEGLSDSLQTPATRFENRIEWYFAILNGIQKDPLSVAHHDPPEGVGGAFVPCGNSAASDGGWRVRRHAASLVGFTGFVAPKAPLCQLTKGFSPFPAESADKKNPAPKEPPLRPPRRGFRWFFRGFVLRINRVFPPESGQDGDKFLGKVPAGRFDALNPLGFHVLYPVHCVVTGFEKFLEWHRLFSGLGFADGFGDQMDYSLVLYCLITFRWR